MSKIMAVNAGSSSLKFQLLEMPKEEVITEGLFEKIGLKDPHFTIKYHGLKEEEDVTIQNHQDAVEMLLKVLIEKKIVHCLEEISGVGHRILHCGEFYHDSVLMTEESIKKIESVNDLGPLHNPANLMGVRAFMKALPKVPNVGVFDTSFHLTMEKEAYMYAVPYEWYQKYGVRKYGFHGTSHKYVSYEAAKHLNKPLESLRLITCHMGNGVSLAAVKYGKCVDTTMGLTPLDGVPMGTRSGDLDPSVVTYIMKKENLKPDEMDRILNYQSGIYGVSGASVDFRDVEAEAAAGDHRSDLAMKIFLYDVAQKIAEYAVAMQGIDVITFTAGVGEKGMEDREAICEYLKCFGVKIDKEINNHKNIEAKISTSDSKIEVWVVPTNEELLIAEDTERILRMY